MSSSEQSTYTLEEFAQKCKLRGYVESTDQACEWAKRNGKTEFTEDDLLQVYHAFDSFSCIGGKTIGYGEDGKWHWGISPMFESYWDDIRFS